MTFDLYVRILRNNCLGYFSQNPQIRNWCKNWWELCLFTSCSLLSMCFSFSLFIFVLPARYVLMRNFLGKSKQTQTVYRPTFTIKTNSTIFQKFCLSHNAAQCTSPKYCLLFVRSFYLIKGHVKWACPLHLVF